MRVTYLGPMLLGLKHPALAGLDPNYFDPSAFAVEVSEDAGCKGPIMESDVLIAEERDCTLHEDLVIVRYEEQYQLMRAFRLGMDLRYISLNGGDSFFAGPERLMGVVVRQLRQYS